MNKIQLHVYSIIIHLSIIFCKFLHILFFCYKQIPFGILAKRFGALNFLGWGKWERGKFSIKIYFRSTQFYLHPGMLVNSVFAFLVPIAAERGGWVWLTVIRFIQGLGEGPIVSDLIIFVY